MITFLLFHFFNLVYKKKSRRMSTDSNIFINGELILKDDEGEIAEFVSLEVDNNFEILTVGSHTIRSKENHKEIRFNHDLKYKCQPMIVLNGKIYPYIQIIENQFNKD